MSDLTSEDATLAKARTLGVTLPSFRQSDYPALFCSWLDDVLDERSERIRDRIEGLFWGAVCTVFCFSVAGFLIMAVR